MLNIDNFFQDYFHSFRDPFDYNNSIRTKTNEDKEKLDLLMELPGFAEDEISVETTNQYLVVKAEHKESRKNEYISESKISRSWSLPDSLDVDGIQASLKNGILKVTIPKIEKKLKRVDVKLLGG